MEKLLRIASPLGLYAEEFDATRQASGQLPAGVLTLALLSRGANHRPRAAEQS
jgi:hypothetical protein